MPGENSVPIEINVCHPATRASISTHPSKSYVSSIITYGESRFRAIIPVIANLPAEKKEKIPELLKNLRKEVVCAMNYPQIICS